eukprot:2355967-Rhodomonas_salina.3
MLSYAHVLLFSCSYAAMLRSVTVHRPLLLPLLPPAGRDGPAVHWCPLLTCCTLLLALEYVVSQPAQVPLLPPSCARSLVQTLTPGSQITRSLELDIEEEEEEEERAVVLAGDVCQARSLSPSAIIRTDASLSRYSPIPMRRNVLQPIRGTNALYAASAMSGGGRMLWRNLQWYFPTRPIRRVWY